MQFLFFVSGKFQYHPFIATFDPDNIQVSRYFKMEKVKLNIKNWLIDLLGELSENLIYNSKKVQFC